MIALFPSSLPINFMIELLNPIVLAMSIALRCAFLSVMRWLRSDSSAVEPMLVSSSIAVWLRPRLSSCRTNESAPANALRADDDELRSNNSLRVAAADDAIENEECGLRD